MKKKGFFLTLEGNEGCGKTTHIRLLGLYLKRRGPVYVTREPGGTKIGDAIRAVLLDNKHKGMTGETEALLYMASRAQLVSEAIAPRLAAGETVLSDRWLDATVAYQGYGAGVDVDWIQSLGRHISRGFAPDLTIFMDLKLETGLKRAALRREKDRIEAKDLEFHRRVRKGYLAIADADPKRFKRLAIGEDEPVESVQKRLRGTVDEFLG